MKARALAGLALGVAVSGPLAAARAAEPASTCVSCHAAEEDEQLSAPVEEWRRSVHAAANVGCDACHGGDPRQKDAGPSMDAAEAGFLGVPGRKEIIASCSACHEKIAASFEQSVMGRKSLEGERVATCLTCHMIDGHAVQRSDVREILTELRCGECHSGERAIFLRDALEGIDLRIQRAEARIAPLRAAIDTSRLDAALREAHEHAVVCAHTYDLARIREVAAGTTERLGRLDEDAGRLEVEVARRRRIGFAVFGFFALACLATLRISSNLRRRASPDDHD